MGMFSIRAEGWRFVAHSYAIVNEWQCLELMRRDDIELYFRDLPFVRKRWEQARKILPEKWEAALEGLHDTGRAQKVDCVIRISVPVRLKTGHARRTLVLGTADFGWLPSEMIAGGRTLAEAHRESDAIIISPSEWSRWGLLRAGADPDRVAVVPHGVDPLIFHPAPHAVRKSLRDDAGYADRFVFLNVSAHTLSKGTDLILKAFARVAMRRSEAFLVLKGSDSIYDSKEYVQKWMTEKLTAEEREAIRGRIHYVGKILDGRNPRRDVSLRRRLCQPLPVRKLQPAGDRSGGYRDTAHLHVGRTDRRVYDPRLRAPRFRQGGS